MTADSGAGTFAERFNAAWPVGTPVRYWPILGDGDYEETRTRSVAWHLGSGHTVVKVEGRAGGVSLEHIAVLLDPRPRQ